MRPLTYTYDTLRPEPEPPFQCGSEEMLRGLACFEPTERWSVGHAMRSPLFDSYRIDAADAALAVGVAEAGRVLEYMHDLHDDA